MSKEKEKKAEEPRVLRRFWKSRRSLPTEEWDAERDKARFEFVDGICETDDPKIADYLAKRGYMELAVGEEPPPSKPPLEDLPDPEELRPRNYAGLTASAAAREAQTVPLHAARPDGWKPPTDAPQ